MKEKLIQEMKNAFKAKQANRLKQVSNQALEQAIMTGDQEFVFLSLVSYALYKILTKTHYRTSPHWKNFEEHVLLHLDQCLKEPDKAGDVLEEKLVEDIKGLDESHSHYAQDLIEKARVKQASRAYAMGLSMNSAVELTGATKFKVYEYVGKTNIHEDIPPKKLKERFAYTKKILGGE